MRILLACLLMLMSCAKAVVEDPERPRMEARLTPPHGSRAVVDVPWVHEVVLLGTFIEHDSNWTPFVYVVVGYIDGEQGLLRMVRPNAVQDRIIFYNVTFTRHMYQQKAEELKEDFGITPPTVRVSYRLYRISYSDLREDMTSEEKWQAVMSSYLVATAGVTARLVCFDCMIP